MGPEATLLMFAKILEHTPASKDQEHLRVIIDNNPKIPERLPAILGVGENPVPMMRVLKPWFQKGLICNNLCRLSFALRIRRMVPIAKQLKKKSLLFPID